MLSKNTESSLVRFTAFSNKMVLLFSNFSLLASSNFANKTLHTSKSALFIGFLLSGYLSDFLKAQLLNIFSRFHRFGKIRLYFFLCFTLNLLMSLIALLCKYPNREYILYKDTYRTNKPDKFLSIIRFGLIAFQHL